MKIIGIYPGNYQPPTRAHASVFKQVEVVTGKGNTFVVTTDRNPIPQAPLNYGDKQSLLVQMKIPANQIVKVVDWKEPTEVFREFDPKLTSVVYALNAGPATHLINSNPGYWLKYDKHQGLLRPMSQKRYIMVIDDTKIEGRSATSENIRHILGTNKYDDKTKHKLFHFFFGFFDIAMYTNLVAKYRTSDEASPSQGLKEAEPYPRLTTEVKSVLSKMVGEVLDEVMSEFYDSNVNSPDSSTNIDSMSTSIDKEKEPAEDPAKTKQNLIKKKQELELQDKEDRQKADFYKTGVKSYNQVQKKQNRDALDQVNKAIATASSTAATAI